jgi:signal transduction histidine kinase
MRACILFILLTGFAANTGRSQVQLNEADNSFSADGSVFLAAETGTQLSIGDAISLYKKGGFKLTVTKDNVVNLGFTQLVYWLAVPLNNMQQKAITIDAGVANAGVYHLETYEADTASGATMSYPVTGKTYHFNSRTIRNRHYYFPVTIPPGSTRIMFFRADCRGNGFHAPLRFLKPSYRQQSEERHYTFYAFSCGILVFVSIFSFVSFVWNRDRVYLYYSLYVVFCCLFFLADGDLDVQWLYPNVPAWATVAPSMYAAGLVLFMLLFMNKFLQLHESHKWLSNLSRLWVYLIILLLIMIPVSHSFSKNILFRTATYNYGVICFAGGWLLQLYSVLRRLADRYPPAYLYAAGIVPVLFSSLFYILHSFNLINTSFLPFNYLLLGFIIEIIILSFALIYSHNFHRQKHQQLSAAITQQQLEFGKQLLQTQEDEQKRIAQDLHDELGGNLAAIKMTLQSFQLPQGQSQLMLKLIDDASANARNISHNLMPPEFEKTKLDDLLGNYYQRLNTEGNTRFHFHSSGSDHHFSKPDELMIYRVIMELTNNIVKHAQASEATIQLVYYEKHLELVAEDNGKGLSNKNVEGIGLKNIRSRVNYLGGAIHIDSGPHGTTVMINIPYKQQV